MIKYRDIYLPVQSKVLSIARRLNAHSALALAGILAPLMLETGDLTAGLITPYYSLVKNSISSLALSSIGWLQTIGFLALGLLVEIFTAGLLYNVKRSKWFHLGIAAFVLFGFGMLCIGAFNTDIPGGATTIKGMIHGLATKVSFSLFPIAVLLLAFNFKKDPDWRCLFKYSIVTCILSVLFAIALSFFKDGANYFGLVERILVANIVIWVEVAGINLMRLSLKRGAPVDNEAQIG
ncbi:MAG: DUF998 domain-containing protein [Dehalococcoidales bacterium]